MSAELICTQEAKRLHFIVDGIPGSDKHSSFVTVWAHDDREHEHEIRFAAMLSVEQARVLRDELTDAIARAGS